MAFATTVRAQMRESHGEGGAQEEAAAETPVVQVEIPDAAAPSTSSGRRRAPPPPPSADPAQVAAAKQRIMLRKMQSRGSAENSAAAPASDGPWTCNFCTYSNPKVHAPVCEMCGQPRNDELLV